MTTDREASDMIKKTAMAAALAELVESGDIEITGDGPDGPIYSMTEQGNARVESMGKGN
jgi:lysophospholipid acyltransferase (LPLAT)-like uncharacterized protein